MSLRAQILVLVLGAAAGAQDAAGPRLAEVLGVLDAETLDASAFDALIGRGPAAVAVLVQTLSSPAAAPDLAARRRDRALRALRALGADAAAAGPGLIEALRSAERAEVPALLDTLARTAALGPDPGALLGDATAAFAPTITPGDPQFIDRLKGAIRVHVRLSQPLPADDQNTLIGALENADPYVRELAADLLGKLGPAARPALDALERTVLADDQPRRAGLPNHSLGTDFAPMIRDAAAVAIARIAPSDPRAVRGLRLLLGADAPRERIEAAMALGRLGDPSAEGELRQALADEDLRLCAEAATALGMIEASSPRTVDALRRLLDHEERGIAARARIALVRAGVTPPAAPQKPGGASKGTETKR
jgi:HEAT repeat protein